MIPPALGLCISNHELFSMRIGLHVYIYFQKLNAEKTGVFNTCPAHLYFEQLPLCFYVYILSAEWRQMRSSLPNPELARLATSNLPRLLLGSKSTSTANKQYTAAWSKWQRWADSAGVPTLPVSPYPFCLF